MRVCRKCGGKGYRARLVAALGPIRPGGLVYTVDGYDLPYVPASKIGTAHVVHECHVCKGKGNLD